MIHMLPAWKFCCRLAVLLLLSGSGPERELLEKGSFVVCSVRLRLHRSPTTLFGDVSFCCCNMLIWCYWVRCKVEGPAVLLLPGKWMKRT